MQGIITMLDELGKKFTEESFERYHDACMKDTVLLKQTSGRKYLATLGYRTKESGSLRFKVRDDDNTWSEEGYKELMEKYACRKGGEKVDPYYGDEGHPVGNMCYDDPDRM